MTTYEKKRYCACALDGLGHVCEAMAFIAFDDADAEQHASYLDRGYGVELWVGQEMLKTIAPYERRAAAN